MSRATAPRETSRPPDLPRTCCCLSPATRSHDEFARQAADGVPGVVMRPTRMLLRGPNHHIPW